MHKIIFILIFILSPLVAFNQGEVNFHGRIIDSIKQTPIEFASVLFRDKKTNTLLGGVKSDVSGSFNYSSSKENVHVEVRMTGYENKIIEKFSVVEEDADLGFIKLNALTQLVEQVEVRAEKSTVEFKLDKRVFNVGQDLSSSGASALEVLNHVPSVTVSIEGVISLRGSSGVQILIDGKPSVLADEGSNALGSLTADMIEKIEVITNPSANYESEGTSGIINIILKKEEKKGANGSVSLNFGWPHNHSLGFSMNYRTQKFNLFTQLGVGYRSLPNYNLAENNNRSDSIKILSEGINYRNEQFNNIVLGSDYYINQYNTMTLSGNFAYEIEQQPSETKFESYYGDALMDKWTRTEETSALNPKFQYDFNYKKEFKDTSEHTLLFTTLAQFFAKDQSSVFSNRSELTNTTLPQQRTRTSFKQADWTYKLDYNKPFSNKITLGTGAQYVINDVGNDYQVENEVAGTFYTDSSLTNNFEYVQKVLGIYGTGSYEGKKWGVKLGLRGENTDLKTRLVNTNEQNNQNYFNFFPSLHTSYKISRMISMQAGYSRRIFRPRLWDLNPFFNISNNFNIRRGNPYLQPEFTDSYELNSIYIFEKVSMNLGVYYRYTTEVVERVSIFENNVNTVLPMNIGTNQMTGVEFNAKYTANKWLTINGDFNYNYFNRKGTFQSQVFDFTGNKWTSRLTTKFKINKAIDYEMTGNYESGFKTIQGSEAQQIYLDAGLRIKIWKGKGVINLSARDIFASRINRTTVDQSNYYLYSYRQRGRFLTLGFSYGFGKGEAMTYSGGRRH